MSNQRKIDLFLLHVTCIIISEWDERRISFSIMGLLEFSVNTMTQLDV
jgi:hypothetical protein